MGVPAFFRWLSRKYPKCIEDVVEEHPQLVGGEVRPVDASQPNPNGQEFDNLYLDMNGIIHPASHPEDKPAPKTEDDMYIAVTEYLERVFNSVRPRKLLYMAIDGVAPRAKMNQQRSRRFRAAKEREDMEKCKQELLSTWAAEGRELPPPSDEQVFDSNVITPGTPFMDKLAEHLRLFVMSKISSDPAWMKIKVIFSDATVPGEGEHKIIDFIRTQRAQKHYNPNTSHVIHGLDADLIMLALATHEPHFTILREEVFSKQADLPAEVKAQKALQAQLGEAQELKPVKPFQFLRINILREYLEREMRHADYSSAGGFNLERLIDDFVFMCFFVGNDFLPHLPSLDIHEGALDTLLDLYKTEFPHLGGYLTAGSRVDLRRVQIMFDGLAEVEDHIIEQRRIKAMKFAQKDMDVKNKKTTKKHLQLIKSCASYTPADADEPDTKRAKTPSSDMVGPEDFRIKHRTIGGKRALKAEVNYDSAEKLHLLDKIRSFYDEGVRTKTLELRSLKGYQRAIAHDYAQELGLKHFSEGQDPNRYIVISFKDQGPAKEPTVADTFKEAVKQMAQERGDKLVEANEDTVKVGTEGWKDRYYEQKFGSNVEKRAIIKSYVEGLVWVMRYYYEGCVSWNWFYPYHYAPCVADFKGVSSLDITFEKGRPFAAYEQLLAVFPPASASSLPPAYQKLMKEPDSPLRDFYPLDFGLDMDGKKYAWQAVVLLPFIDEARLLAESNKLLSTLTPEEARRNSHGTDLVLTNQMNGALAEKIYALSDAAEDAVAMATMGTLESDADTNANANAALDADAEVPEAAVESKEPSTDSDQQDESSQSAAPVPTEEEMNRLAALHVRAKLKGNVELAAELQAKLDKLRQEKSSSAAKDEGNDDVEAQAKDDQNDRIVRERYLSHLPAGVVEIDALDAGFAGYLHASPYFRGCEPIHPPPFHGLEVDHPYRLQEFVNAAMLAQFFLPAPVRHHPFILRNVQMPPAVLTDLDPIKPPRFVSVAMVRRQRMGHGYGNGRPPFHHPRDNQYPPQQHAPRGGRYDPHRGGFASHNNYGEMRLTHGSGVQYSNHTAAAFHTNHRGRAPRPYDNNYGDRDNAPRGGYRGHGRGGHFSRGDDGYSRPHHAQQPPPSEVHQRDRYGDDAGYRRHHHQPHYQRQHHQHQHHHHHPPTERFEGHGGGFRGRGDYEPRQDEYGSAPPRDQPRPSAYNRGRGRGDYRGSYRGGRGSYGRGSYGSSRGGYQAPLPPRDDYYDAHDQLEPPRPPQPSSYHRGRGRTGGAYSREPAPYPSQAPYQPRPSGYDDQRYGPRGHPQDHGPPPRNPPHAVAPRAPRPAGSEGRSPYRMPPMRQWVPRNNPQ